MYKTQSYDISASFLVPAYNLPSGVLSHYVTTVNEQHANGNTSTDIWLVKAEKEDPKKTMIASLRKERANYQIAMEKELSEAKQTNDLEKSSKMRQLEKAKALFTNLVAQAQDSVYHKQPDDKFLKIVHSNFARAAFSSCQPDLNKYLYLAGLSRYEER